MNRYIELLAPGGDIESIKAAIAAGADAIYCGLSKFNARNRAVNIGFDDLNGILHLAHNHNCQVFLTLNILIVESEIPALLNVLKRISNTSIDGIIIQDIGLLYLISKYFPNLKIHASTQLTTHNAGQIQFLNKVKVTRVNLSRELSINEISLLSTIAHENDILIEVFVHGSLCISFSGLCYMSSVHGGNSGNRGRCSQPCRDPYIRTSSGNDFPLNLKDNSAYSDLMELAKAGVDSVKIEGRIKKFHYVFTIVREWSNQLNRLYAGNKLISDKHALYKVFNRDFTNGYLQENISKEMFIDNPRDNSAIYLASHQNTNLDSGLDYAKGAVYDERTKIISNVGKIISDLNVEKLPLVIQISGENGSQLKITIKSIDNSFTVLSDIALVESELQILTYDVIFTRLKAINDTEYFISEIDLKDLQPNMFIPFKELTAIRNKILFILNGFRDYIESVDIPIIKKSNAVITNPTLSILISSTSDIHLCTETNSEVYLQLPNCMGNDVDKFVELFLQNEKLLPCFPAVLIGEHYQVAIDFLQRVKPKRLITNNTGIAFEAYKNGISWIAGPNLNIVNSYSLACLKEDFNCLGSFISNELSRMQIKGIKKLDDFKLYFSIFHPVLLMTSRQCFFQQIGGCDKNIVDDNCIQNCHKTDNIKNFKNDKFIIEKSKGNYHRMFNSTKCLNIDIVSDLPNFFSGYFIDLTDVKDDTIVICDKIEIVKYFDNFINNDFGAKDILERSIQKVSNSQYKKGI